SVELELSIDLREMVPHRLGADASTRRDRGNRLGVPDHGQDLELGWRELVSPAPDVAVRMLQALEQSAHQPRADGSMARYDRSHTDEELVEGGVLREPPGPPGQQRPPPSPPR